MDLWFAHMGAKLSVSATQQALSKQRVMETEVLVTIVPSLFWVTLQETREKVLG